VASHRTDEPEVAGHDPLEELSVERVERADGRYLIYYEWPHRDTDASPAGTEESARGAADV